MPMGIEVDLENWNEFPVNNIECVHVFKYRTYKNDAYRICYKCKCKCRVRKKDVVPYYHGNNAATLVITTLPKPELPASRTPKIEDNDIVYLNGKLVTASESRRYHSSLPDTVPQPKEVFVHDPNYKYIVNPTARLNRLIKAGELPKPKFLIKPK